MFNRKKRVLGKFIQNSVSFMLVAGCTALYADDPDFVLIDEESSGESGSSEVVIHERDAGSASAAYDDPNELEVSEEDFSEVCGIIMYEPSDDPSGNGTVRFVPQVPSIRSVIPSLNLNLPSVNFAPRFNLPTVRMPQINVTRRVSYGVPCGYVVRRYIPAKRTYVFKTIRRPPPRPPMVYRRGYYPRRPHPVMRRHHPVRRPAPKGPIRSKRVRKR